ncbi:MAG: NAD(P)H-binding protein [Steroidobacteraceae bacterium]|nr:NAD(P)H-binding protein [Steroidobacteraceae bacterium]
MERAPPPRTAPPAPPAGQRQAWVFGASGLVGRALLDVLLTAPEYARITALTRRPLGREHPRLANRIVAFDRLEAQLAGVACQEAFCCLGTTLAQAGSEAAFRAVDHDTVLRVAGVARRAGAERFVLVSAAGADPAAKNFYLRVKGEAEAAVAALGFPSLDIVQPGLLLGGARAESRPLESLGRLVMPLVNPLLGGERKAWRGMDVAVLARAMAALPRSGRRGVNRYTWEALQRLAAKPQR